MVNGADGRLLAVVQSIIRRWSRPAVRDRLIPLGALVFGLACVRVMLFSPGVPVLGDWVGISAQSTHQFSWIWDALQHNGTLSLDYRAAPWMWPVAFLAGNVSSLRFDVVNRVFVATCVLGSGLLGYWVLSKRFGVPPVAATLSALYLSFNPWAAARAASGHFPLLLAYALLPASLYIGLKARSLRWAMIASALIGFASMLDLQGGVLAWIAYLAAVLSRRKWNSRELLITAVVPPVGALALNLFWILPTIAAMAVIHPASALNSGYGIAAVRGVSAESNPINVIAARSYWWVPFSEGLYTFGALTFAVKLALFAGPAVTIGLLIAGSRKKFSAAARLAAILMTVGAVPSIFAFSLPYAYLWFLQTIPAAALFRDPNKLVSLYLMGLVVAGLAFHRKRRWFWLVASVTVAATMLPWLGGDLRGDFRPVRVRDGEIAATRWLNDHAAASDRVLWFPVESYIYVPWERFGANDPTRFWNSYHLLNPTLDPAFDLSPRYSTALLTLEGTLPDWPHNEVGRILARMGIRFVLVRRDAANTANVYRLDSALRRSDGVILAERFRDVDLFEVDKPLRPTLSVSTRGMLYGGSWAGAISAAIIDPNLSPTLFSETSARAWGIPRETSAVNIALHSIWGALFRGWPMTPLSTDEQGAYLAPSGALMPEFYRGFRAIIRRPGITAFRLVGANGDVRLSCVGESAAKTPLFAYEQPDSRERWVAAECPRGVRLFIRGGKVFIQGYVSLTRRQYMDRMALIATMLARPGSGYVLTRSDFTPLNGTIAITHRENPLVLPAGRYTLHVSCARACGASGELKLFNEEYPRLRPLAVAISSGERSAQGTATVSAGYYSIRIPEAAAERLAFLTIEPSASAPPVIDTTVRPSETFAKLPQAFFAEINSNPGPWIVRNAKGVVAPPLPGSPFGTSYYIGLRGDVAEPATLSGGLVTFAGRLGFVTSALALLCLASGLGLLWRAGARDVIAAPRAAAT